MKFNALWPELAPLPISDFALSSRGVQVLGRDQGPKRVDAPCQPSRLPEFPQLWWKLESFRVQTCPNRLIRLNHNQKIENRTIETRDSTTMKIAAVRADAPQSLQSAMMTLTGIRHYQTQSCCHVQSTVDCDPVDTQFQSKERQLHIEPTATCMHI